MRRPALLVACALPLLVALAVGPAAAADDGNVTVYRTADHVAADLDGPAALRDAIENGTVETTDFGDDNATELLVGDVAVFAVESPRLAGDVRAHEGNATAGFLASREENATFDVVHVNPGPERPVTRFVLTPNVTRVLVVGDVTYVLVRTGAVDLTAVESMSSYYSGKPFVEEGEMYHVDFGYGPNGSSEFPHRGAPALEFVQPDAAPPDGPAVLANDSVTVEGRTTFPPTSPVSVRLSLPEGTRTADAQVRNWTYAATFDLSDVPNGTTYDLAVRHGAQTYASTTGVVREERARIGNVSATLYQRPVSPPEYELWLSGEGYLSHGGAIRVRQDGETLTRRAVPDGAVNWSVEVSGWDPGTESVVVEAVGPAGERYARGDARTVVETGDLEVPAPETATDTATATPGVQPEDQAPPGFIATLFALLAVASLVARR